uniref:SJCHGC07161 protein n=1 Tax=Schistosoma japonicum TaxID=6182 RepID=Q5D8Y2_SCHJA|nr:SJCHGC07161 protein [Schistosoma japonicum]
MLINTTKGTKTCIMYLYFDNRVTIDTFYFDYKQRILYNKLISHVTNVMYTINSDLPLSDEYNNYYLQKQLNLNWLATDIQEAYFYLLSICCVNMPGFFVLMFTLKLEVRAFMQNAIV